MAAIDLRAGRKAKASAAYDSARAYFAAGMALLDEGDWSSRYELTFSLWLECAECEFLTGRLDRAEQRVGDLLRRAASKVDEAAVYHLKVQLHIMKSEIQHAVEAGLTCLRGFGIEMPAHPTEEQVQAEYETVWRTLDGRPIESLIDLPLMTDPELQAAMKVLSVLLAPTLLTDFRLCCFPACRMVTLSVQYGASGDSAFAYAYWAQLLGPVFHRYGEGYRFAKLAGDLVDKHGFIAGRGRVYIRLGSIAVWTQPITTAIDFNQTGIRAAVEAGDLYWACIGMQISIAYLLSEKRPTRPSVAQVRDSFGLRPKGRVRRCCGHCCHPATVHRRHAGADRDLLHLQRCGVRRGDVRGSVHRRPEPAIRWAGGSSN